MRVRSIVLASCLGFCFLAARPALPAEEEGFKPIFDGKSLSGWDGDPRFWKVDGEAIVGQTTAENPTQGNTFIIWRRGEVDDFDLRLEFKITGGNSGIQVRSFENPAEWGKWVIGGYQADIEAGDRFTGIIYGERYRGVLADRGQKTVIGPDHKPRVEGSVGDPDEIAKAVKKGEWNEYRIVARGNRVSLFINGRPTAETIDEDKETARRSGLLALQLHAGPPMKVEFRKIQLKRVPLGDKKKIVLVAGKASHGSGEHAHGDGCALLADALNKSGLPVLAAVYKDGWPADPTALDNADALSIYCDGGDGHIVLPHLEEVDRLAKKGMGIACLHYAVEVPKEKAGAKFLEWIGGYFEMFWSVNPFWIADFKKFPDHPIARGVKPFKMQDEWYYHMRFPEGMKGVTAILEAVPPDETRNRPDGPHSGNPVVRARKGMPEIVGWALERPGGGRGFGFTGGHTHKNWEDENFRRVVLNALVWIAGAEVPAGGVR
jgi:type 1 glutamine amidotransferase